jgi:hypothetical protein
MASRRLLVVDAVDATVFMVVAVAWELVAFRFESAWGALLLAVLWCRWYGVVDDEDASALVMMVAL